jgi:hypothetical protein
MQNQTICSFRVTQEVQKMRNERFIKGNEKKAKSAKRFLGAVLQKNEKPPKRGLCTTYGIRTRDSSVKGRRLNPLTNAAFLLKDGKDNDREFCSQIF